MENGKYPLTDPTKLNLGDITARKMRIDGTEHWAVVVATGNTPEDVKLIELSPQGAREVNLTTFLGEKHSFRIVKFTGATYTAEEIVRRAREALAKGDKTYQLLQYNCEHFARECVTGRPECQQADTIRESGRKVGLASAILGGGVALLGLALLVLVEMTQSKDRG
jgi:hypothetical protein